MKPVTFETTFITAMQDFYDNLYQLQPLVALARDTVVHVELEVV